MLARKHIVAAVALFVFLDLASWQFSWLCEEQNHDNANYNNTDERCSPYLTVPARITRNMLDWLDRRDNIDMLSTAFIALFTFTLWRSTYGLLKATKITADIAKKSADAIPAIERAYIFFSPINSNFSESLFSLAASNYYAGQDDVIAPPRPQVKVDISNGGRTAAILVNITLGLFHSEENPNELNFASFPAQDLREPIIKANGSLELDPRCAALLTIGEHETLRGGARSFYLQGRVLYRTVIDGPDDDPRETIFCWRFNTRDGFWREWGGARYNKRT